MNNIDVSRTPIPKRKRNVLDAEDATTPVVVTAHGDNKAPPQKKAKKTTAIDDVLEDAVSDGDDTNDDRSMPQLALQSIAPPDTTRLIRADDPVKNRVLAAMTDPIIRAAYLQEVCSRTLYIENDPFPTNSKATDSGATPEVRVALKDRLVNELTWEACVPAYNNNGGNVATFAGVEKQVKQHAWKWFAEQNVVVPWMIIGPKEKKRLGALGLKKCHFPTLVAPVLSTTATSNSQSVAKPRTPKAKPKKTAPAKAKADQNVEEQAALTQSKKRPQRAASDFATHEQQSHDHRSKQNYLNDKEDPTPLLIRDHIRATYNLYGKNVVEVKLDGTSHWANSAVLEKYCGAYSEQSSSSKDEIVDFGCKGISPMIMRAFFQAISPFPRNELPSHDVILDPEMSLNHEDVALVILPDDPKPREIDWSLDACAEMYRLATVLNSSTVKDMVADKMLQIYLDHCEQEEEKSLNFPIKFTSSLTMEEDLPLLRLLVDIALDQSRRGHGRPNGLSKHVTRLLEGRFTGWGGRMHMIYNRDQAALCSEYHLHGRGRPCHTAIDARYTTEHLITDVFMHIRQETCKAATAEFAEEDEQDEDGDTPKIALDVYKLLLWSRDNEKEVALCMLEYEQLATKLNATWAQDEEADPKDEKRAQWLAEKITALRMAHNERWPDYGEEEEEDGDLASYGKRLFSRS